MTLPIQQPALVPATAPRRRCGACPVAAILGVFALILQLLAPGLARASQTDWMEICSDQGVVVVPMNFGDDEAPQSPRAPDGPCECCGFCLAYSGPAAAVPPNSVSLTLVHGVARAATLPEAQTDRAVPRAVWPSPRGPPSAPKNMTDRAPVASDASTPNKGGALWT
ncbi:DUF2946 family protein [Aquicoccus sp. SU-CL01552]|uniref:DUF2946 family protein n=1 Tax=Aquicoccus sp. SU-CL01552 TaxID=3127656 RepID=UPI0031090037